MADANGADETLWTVADLAEYFKLSPRACYRIVKQAGFPVKVLGPRALRFHPERVKAWAYRNDTLEVARSRKRGSRSTNK